MIRIAFAACALVLVGSALGADFFEIKDIKYLQKPGKDGLGVWKQNDPRNPRDDEFEPCMEVSLQVSKPIRSDGLHVRGYFIGDDGKITATRSPSPAGTFKSTARFDLPVIFPEKEIKKVFFRVPEELNGKRPQFLVVFGDKDEMVAKRFPEGSLVGIDFPNKDKVLAAKAKIIDRDAVLDPVTSHVIQTKNPQHPQITLLLRMPNRSKDASQVKGVLAMCVLANSVESIHRQLQAATTDEYRGILNFADRHNLAVLCWGARTLWRPDASYDELDEAANKRMSNNFDDVANAWERGVLELNKKYGLPKDQFFLWGLCGSAQWAHRLALRKPDYFMAAFLHIPSSFDRPTPDGAKILWLLTTGERDSGYQRGIRWFRDCTAAGYPIIFKAVQNLGHASSPVSDALGMKFFEYAFNLREQRAALDLKWAEFKKEQEKQEVKRPWLDDLANPKFVGDLQNQEVFPYGSRELIPTVFRVPLPNETLAAAWDK